ncbi:MAG: SWIM zinc finger domain-containing protein, partial [Lachnospiraceae bacterium]|nr:SWIM zinc finger domain-containing protein [Lachnospiraceae bacterium]
MIEWKYKFERNTLERGLAFYLNKRVADLEKNNGTYTAAVLGIRYFEVQIKMQDGYPASMKCNCPISEEGENCEHMAAVLYAIEAKEQEAESHHSEEDTTAARYQSEPEFEEDTTEDAIEDTTEYAEDDKKEDPVEYTLLGGSPSPDPEESSSLMPTSTPSESIASLEHYNYFNGTAIRKSMDIPKSSYVEGENLLRQGKIKIMQIKSGYDQDNGRILGQLDAIGKSGTDEFSIQLQFSRTKVINFGCRCPKCRQGYYMWFSRKTTCGYKAGVLIKLEEYLAVHNIGDATDLNAKRLMSFYQEKRANLTAAGTIGKENSLKLIPRVIKKGGKLAVSFKVGEKKLFIVKHLDTFCQNVKESAIDVYGTNTQINHSPKNFTEKGRGWIHFISRICRLYTSD